MFTQILADSTGVVASAQEIIDAFLASSNWIAIVSTIGSLLGVWVIKAITSAILTSRKRTKAEAIAYVKEAKEAKEKKDLEDKLIAAKEEQLAAQLANNAEIAELKKLIKSEVAAKDVAFRAEVDKESTALKATSTAVKKGLDIDNILNSFK